MKIKPPYIEVYYSGNPPTPYHLQAFTETLAAMLMEGRLASALLYARWPWRGRIVGLYEASTTAPVARRITGGPSVDVDEQAYYASLIHASGSLGDSLKLAGSIAECLGSGIAYGATRLGRGKLAAGVIELIINRKISIGDILACIEPVLGYGEEHLKGEPEWNALGEKPEAYAAMGWRLYHGSHGMTYMGVRPREGNIVRIGVEVSNGFIAAARVDGVFNAAPPNEPFNVISMIEGMPVDESTMDAVEVRLESMLEIAGVTKGDFLEALREALAASGWRE